MNYKLKRKQIESKLKHNKEMVQRTEKILGQLAQEQIKILGKLELIDEFIKDKKDTKTTQKEQKRK